MLSKEEMWEKGSLLYTNPRDDFHVLKRPDLTTSLVEKLGQDALFPSSGSHDAALTLIKLWGVFISGGNGCVCVLGCVV